MRQFLVYCLIMILAAIALGCSSGQGEEQYQMLVVEGEENISGTFSEFTGEGQPVQTIEYITSLKNARDTYPRYEIEQAPAVFIFETEGGKMKDLKLKTYRIDEAIEFLQN